MTHPILSGLSKVDLAVELRDSRAELEARIGAPCRLLAYPNGSRDDFSTAVMGETQRAGYTLAFSVEDRRAGTRPPRFAVPRFAVPGHLPVPLFQAKVSGLYALLGRRH